MIKAVLDTNVFLSALFWDGNPRKVLQLAISKKIGGITSPEILEEIEKKLCVKFDYPKDQTKAFLGLILENFEFTKPKRKTKIVKEDPSDNKIIDAAIESGTRFIVTGDNHLFKLNGIKGLKIVNPKDFLGCLDAEIVQETN